ncbi:hypothetical protein G9G63_09395 [Paenibacillus sp. EKM202P]|uniref:hypothetical protein n=1 Tax=unclassified Paenibacillus TaxID=185978 RepID=UPI0013E9AE06|nr:MULTISPECIES: hypothetical protein [unclassified Paenibacillus]KAF6565363.1 hypothetical protein G9G63_09395 [Paenibacillus sp. EKM202P]KAF6569312.1 hypothetical protein G9G64_12700 [Paenibacillus sp. EKM207P]
MKQIILNIDENDRVNLEAEGFIDSLEDLEEIFYVLASGTRMIATKVEEMKSQGEDLKNAESRD